MGADDDPFKTSDYERIRYVQEILIEARSVAALVPHADPLAYLLEATILEAEDMLTRIAGRDSA